MEMIITVDKVDLLAKIRDNRGRHRTVFLAALEGYKQEALRTLRGHIKAIEAGKIPPVSFSLARPEDHTRDYDRVIGMLEMDQGVTFRLDQGAYQNYVDDDWTWKRQWSRLSSSYAPGEYSKNYTVVDDEDEW
jgi:hypothetical protein